MSKAGHHCIDCGTKLAVTATTPSNDPASPIMVYRNRHCPKCKTDLTTIEIPFNGDFKHRPSGRKRKTQ